MKSAGGRWRIVAKHLVFTFILPYGKLDKINDHIKMSFMRRGYFSIYFDFFFRSKFLCVMANNKKKKNRNEPRAWLVHSFDND